MQKPAEVGLSRLGLDSRMKLGAALFFHDNPDSVDTAESVGRWLGYDRHEMEAALTEMAEAGLLQKHGAGRGAVYSFTSDPALRESVDQVAAHYYTAKRAVDNELERLQREKRLTESRLREVELSLEVIARNMADGLLVSDAQGHLRLCNAPASRWLEISPPLPGGQLEEDVLWPQLRSLVQRAREAAPGQVHECEVSVPGPEERVLRAVAAPIVGDDNQVLGAVTVLGDITDLKRLDQMKSDLVSFVSHELKTPLTSLRGYASTLLRTDIKVTEDKRREFLETIRNEVDRLTRMINSFLDLSRVQAGQPLQLSRGQFPLAPVVEEATQVILASHPEAHIRLEVAPGMEVRGDRDKLAQMFVNLLSNAVKYSPPGSPVTVRGKQEGKNCLVEVEDRGPGIPPEQMPFLFRRFSRLAGRTVEGAGIGLFLSKHLVEAHGGTIAVTSTSEGSTFSVTIPSAGGSGG